MLAFLLTWDHGLHLYTVQNPLPRAWCHPQWTESSHLRHQDNPSGMSIGRLSKQCSYMVGVWVSVLNFLNDGPWPGSQIFSLLQIVFFKIVFVTAKGNELERMWTGKYLQLLWLLSNFPISRFLQICVVCVLIEALFTNFSLRMACLSCQFCFHLIPTQLFVVFNHVFLAVTATVLVMASLEMIIVGTFLVFLMLHLCSQAGGWFYCQHLIID